LKNDANVSSKVISKKTLIAILKVTEENEQDPDPNPDPLVRSTDPYVRVTDPRIQSRTKISRIRNTDKKNTEYGCFPTQYHSNSSSKEKKADIDLCGTYSVLSLYLVFNPESKA
jgi:hypothetical protein